MTSSTEDRNFIAAVIDSTLLKESIEWIQSNMSPEDVFTPVDLGVWALDNGYVEEE